jgi:catechol 2,3-dioxygenase-like lactoylglutathione lyase family enzyme
MKPTFSGGPNIAMKVPPHHFETTVAFYRDTLGLAEIEESKPNVVFQFGANRLWIDPTPEVEQAELWLQVQTDDLEGAVDHLEQLRSMRADGIEPLPDGFSGFWISSPAGVVHLASKRSAP